MQSRVIIISVIFILALSFSYALADVPQMINYQGKLTKPNGDLVDTTISMLFSIYADSSGGTALWSETHGSVVVEYGVFNILLGGATTPIPDSVFAGSVRYLGIKVGTDSEMLPRKAIVSVGYAYRSAVADSAINAGGGADNDWTYRITDTADTTLMMGGQWGIARYGNVLYSNQDSTHVNLGVACTTGTSGQDNKYCTVGGGVGNIASEWNSTIGGGYINSATGSSATVGGGNFNIASAHGSTVGGGGNNVSNNNYSTVAGGSNNTASFRATVGGGSYNTANSGYSTVAGGENNTASNTHSTVGGGENNTASGSRATVGGGYYNTASSSMGVVAGGQSNTAGGTHQSAVGGGYGNIASHNYATVAGGYADTASGEYAAIGGGRNNTASGLYAAVGGGQNNEASGNGSTIAGGFNNEASGSQSIVPGGYGNTSAGYSSIAAGFNVTINGNYSFGFGQSFTCTLHNAIVFSTGSNATRMGINETNPTYAVHLPNIASQAGQGMANAWNTYSSIRWKENIKQIENPLEKVMTLRGVYFDWKEGNKRDVGLIAEEVGEVIPELVTYEENGEYAEGLDYSRLSALFVEAIKDQQKEIELLKKEIEILKRSSK